ncbi:hypothetical protein M514_09023 [Trichuris suis]|uniref:Uncharacterized protein n=1 Tax=Trichuris suis TaxID=68888 RepID=A0A085MZ92_9BILA|nr:hypothetical protein M513_09023 [Trichuris suis]KFD62538.1 hypothetical protein M514_09023 [Trichuris suis]
METTRAAASMDVRIIPEFDGSSHSAAERLRKAESTCQLPYMTAYKYTPYLVMTGADWSSWRDADCPILEQF